jgi:molybdopterin-guanine dinucleotide biosynthesis protein A
MTGSESRSGPHALMDAIILSGGQGLRMGGTVKAFLRLGSTTFIERILGILAPLFDSVSIATNAPGLYAHLGVRIVGDEREGAGPLMGLYSGLKASTAVSSFITTADTPLLREGLVRYLAGNAHGCDALVPRWERRVEPLCAVYARSCIPAIEKALSNGRIVSFFPSVRVRFVPSAIIREVDPEGLSFLNVNTLADYERLRRVDAAERAGF